MTHYGNEIETRGTTPSEWLGIGSQVGQLVNEWASRDDLAVFIGSEASQIAPACFNPASAEIEINTEAAFGAFVLPEHIGDYFKRTTQLEWAKATGAVFHEACHARFSRWSLKDAFEALTKDEWEALSLLEESRIEAWGVRVKPANAIFLRACALEIVLGDAKDFEGLSDVRASARLAGLTLARVEAGVLDSYDVEPAELVISRMISSEKMDALRSVWTRFQAHEQHSNPLPLYDLAREWVKIVNEASAEAGEPEQGEEGGEGSGFSEFVKDLLDALSESAENAGIGIAMDVADEQAKEERAEMVAQANSKSTTKAENQKEAKKVFADGYRDGDGSTGSSNSKLVERRKPTSEERISAVKISQLLEKAKYRERSETEVKTVLPPGRLRTRALVQGQALKSKGIHTQTEAWRHTARKHTDDPTLTIGVMVDISGSMGSAMNPMATTAWVMSEAGRRVQADTAMVYYGNDVFPTLRKGQHLSDVKVFTAPDGTEKFDKAFKALDGELNLLYGTGARMLVVVSDGQYTSDEAEKARKWVKECHDNGVAVLWITYDYEHYASRYLKGTDGQVVKATSNASETALMIGKTASAILEKIGKRNA